MARYGQGGSIVDNEGVKGRVNSWSPRDRTVTVSLDGGRSLEIPTALIRKSWTGYKVSRRFSDIGVPDSVGAPETTTIPLVEETASVTKHPVTSRVRVRKEVQTREERIDEPTRSEEIDIERVPVNRTVDGPVPVRTEGDTTIVPLLEETAVVEKRWVLREEIRISKRITTKHAPQTIRLRREEASTNRLDE